MFIQKKYTDFRDLDKEAKISQIKRLGQEACIYFTTDTISLTDEEILNGNWPPEPNITELIKLEAILQMLSPQEFGVFEDDFGEEIYHASGFLGNMIVANHGAEWYVHPLENFPKIRMSNGQFFNVIKAVYFQLIFGTRYSLMDKYKYAVVQLDHTTEEIQRFGYLDHYIEDKCRPRIEFNGKSEAILV